MKKNRFTIKTKEMTISPMDESDIWEGDWSISVRYEEGFREIGRASFKGDKLLGCIPISMNIEEAYRNKGYATEAFKLMTDFAFGYKNIYELSADIDSDNDACIVAVEKAGFVRRKKEGKLETYSIIKPHTVWLGLYLYIGLIAGLVIGIVINMMWTGLILGLIIGIFIGAGMDYRAKKDRESVTGSKDGKNLR